MGVARDSPLVGVIVSVYSLERQLEAVFQLLAFSVLTSNYSTLGNYVVYWAMMTFAWMLINRVGRHRLMVYRATWLVLAFGVLA